jgi:FecR-like protein
MKPSWYRVVVVGVAALMFPVLAWAQAAPEVGVVTTIQGQATVARTASTAPLPLKFRDSIFEKDRINTGERSIVKVLMGGRAIVTVRELSVLTITEEVGRTVVNLESGKIAVGVAKQRMKPGETLEVHTPNAVAAVRGTVFVVEVTRQGAQAGGGNLAANTQVTTVQGSVQVGAIGGNPANTALVNAFQSVGVQGLNLTQVQNMTQQQMNQLVGTFIANKQFGAHQAVWSSMSDKEKGKVVALAAALVPAEDPKAGANGNTFNQAQVLPPTTTLPTPPPPAPPKTIFINGGFETAIFPPGWNLAGSGYVIGSFGQFTVPNGQFMGFISSGPGSQADPTGRFTQSSTLSQSFSVTGGTLYTVKATYNFVSNEYPYWVNLYGGNSPFNDAMEIRIKGPGGQTTQLSQLQVNGAFTPSQVSHQNVSVAGFTAGGDCVTCGWGYTGFKVVSFSWLAPSSGEASLIFEVGDVGDVNYASGLLIDDVSVPQDPPLFLLQGGKNLTSTITDPLVEFTGGSATFDSVMVVAPGSTASLAGPLLRSTDTNLTVATSLLTVLPGGSFVSSTTDPLVSIKGGTHALGTDVAMFDLAGSGTALDADTGLMLATTTALKTGGSLFEADGATITTNQAVRVDQALLEASAPLLHLKNGSQLTSATDAIALGGQSRLTSTAASLVALNASRMLVSMGSLVNVSGGSVLNVSGNLVSLSNASMLSLLNGSLLSVSGGSLASIGGSLVSFGGSGGNLLSVSNNFCGGSCAMIGGIPVALLNGATAANVSIGAGAIQNANLGSVKLATPGTALITVSGAGSKVTVGKK